VAARVAVAAWQWDGWIGGTIAVILRCDMTGIG
jgi:hypothetical protein